MPRLRRESRAQHYRKTGSPGNDNEQWKPAFSWSREKKETKAHSDLCVLDARGKVRQLYRSVNSYEPAKLLSSASVDRIEIVKHFHLPSILSYWTKRSAASRAGRNELFWTALVHFWAEKFQFAQRERKSIDSIISNLIFARIRIRYTNVLPFINIGIVLGSFWRSR